MLTAFLAVEAYHAGATGGSALDEQAHSKRLLEILDAVDPAHRAWVKSRI